MILAGSPAPGLSLTFFVSSDPHYGFRTPEVNNTEVVSDLNSLPGTTYPGGAGTVETPAFVAVTGDLTQSYDNFFQPPAVAWQRFVADYSLTGTEGTLNYPVYEIAGNHDHLNDLWYGGNIRSAIEGRHGSLFYSIDVAGVHMVFADVWPDAAIRAWMADDLAALPANTPVMLYMHDPPDGDVDHVNLGIIDDVDSAALLDTIDDYNIVGIFHGHLHIAGHDTWNGFDVYRAGSSKDSSFSFLVVQVTDDTLTVDEWNWEADTWGFHHSKDIVIPEPSTALLLATGLAGLAAAGRRHSLR